MFPYSIPFQSVPTLKKPYHYPPPAMSFLWCLLSVQCATCPCGPCDRECVSEESSPSTCEQSKGRTTPTNDRANSSVLIQLSEVHVWMNEWHKNEWMSRKAKLMIRRCNRVWFDRGMVWVVYILAWILVLRFSSMLSCALGALRVSFTTFPLT